MTSVEFDGQNLIIFDQRPKSSCPSLGSIKPGIYTGEEVKVKENEPSYIDLKIGETSTTPDRLRIERPSVSTKHLGIEDVFVLTQD